MSMPRQAIRQATCTECDESEDNHTVTDKDMDIDEGSITYDTRCTCGVEGEVIVDEEGTTAGENISHDDASWNQEDDEEQDD